MQRLNVLIFTVVPTLGWKVARALSATRHNVVVAGPENFRGFRLTPWCSRYVSLDDSCWADGSLSPGLAADLDVVCRRESIDVVVPADYDTTMFTAAHGSILRKPRLFPLPSPEQILELHDKWRFSRMLSKLGLPQSKTRLLESFGGADLELAAPLFTKALALSNGCGIERHATIEDFRAWTERQHSRSALPVIVQEAIPGVDVGFSLLADHGTLVASTSFRFGRVGRRTFFEDAELTAMVATIVTESGYNGVGHIDARLDERDGSYRFLEFNPRFWGSLLYSMHARVNFAELGLQLLDGGRLDTRKRVGEVVLPWPDRLAGGAVTAARRLLAA